ncbi:hypothetical protein [Arthrobacter sp. CAL618]|uniref:hypothetical protein n=1 Tax=Arthrobacter sp. CAL618 TaxID=1055770 RepID=UPI001ED9A94A|nr:hypothetical protein [Arthrobacter sp. CAL618]
MTTLLGEVSQSIGDAGIVSEVGCTADESPGLTRRVFGVLVGVTVAGTAAAGGLLAAGTSANPPGVKTSFGSVRLTEAERQMRLPPAQDSSGGGTSAQAVTGHRGHGPAVIGHSVQPANSTWGDHIALRLEVHNATDQPVLFAPGQLRLQVGVDGPTVTNRDAEAVTGPLPAGSTTSLWINFLVPSDETSLSAEFTDPWGGGAPLTLELPSVLHRPGSLAVDHD